MLKQLIVRESDKITKRKWIIKQMFAIKKVLIRLILNLKIDILKIRMLYFRK